MIAQAWTQLRQIRGGRAVPLAPPPIIGLGTGGGFSYVLQDTVADAAGAGAGPARIAGRGQSGPQAQPVFSTFSAATPSIYLDIDRDKAQILKVDPSAIFQALQASLGGYYVNDMNLFGRTWQVQVQAEAEDRSSIDDIYRINVRSADDQDDSAAQPGGGAAGDRTAGADPLQQPRRRDDPGQPRAGRFFRTGAGGDGAGRGEHAAPRISRLVDRCVLSGKAGRGQDHDHPRLRGVVRIPVPGRPVRELDDSGPGSAVGHDRRRRFFRCNRRWQV